MVKQSPKMKFFLLIIMLLFGIYMPINQVTAKSANESNVQQINDLYTYALTDFADFELEVDHINISSSNNISFIEFDYYSDYPKNTISDSYLYTLPQNCNDFYIRLKVNYSTSDVKGVFSSNVHLHDEDYHLASLSVMDAWDKSQAIHFIRGWPDRTMDDYEGENNSAGLSGIVTFETSRVNDSLTSRIMNEDCTVVFLEHHWTSGFHTLLDDFAISHRSGSYNADTHATFYDLYANFTAEIILIPTFEFSSGFIVTYTVCIIGIFVYFKKRKE